MKEGLGLTQQQGLRQRLNPVQVRFGRILEMSTPEFEDEVRRVADENPALELVDTPAALQSADDGDSHDFSESADDLVRADYADPDEIPPYRLRDTASHTAERFESATPAEPDTAAESLEAQLAEADIHPAVREIARYIIGTLDSNGYLTRTAAEIADDMSLSTGIDIPLEAVKAAVEAVRALDPAGIGAADLRDSLILQLERREATVESRTALEILRNHFDLFSKKHYDRIASALEIPEEAVRRAVDLIRTLNPKPGALLEKVSPSDRLRYIVPDFTVDTDEHGRTTVALTSSVPEMAVERSFELDPEHPLRPDDEAFIRARRDEATEFIDLTRMRSRTLMAVMEAIVRLQAPFFATCERSAIRPMVLRDISGLTGLDISVVSRAATGKYVATPRGIFPLKMFFNEGVGPAGSDASQHAVTEALEKLIKSEDPQQPLSDERLTALLAGQGFNVARRTVAKYRERLGIPVARLRKS